MSNKLILSILLAIVVMSCTHRESPKQFDEETLESNFNDDTIGGKQ
jgi:hypothetical protein